MSRLARVVIPGLPHQVTQRGNRRQATFFGDDDYEAYLTILAEQAAAAKTAIWAYCLMPNHVHVVAVPVDEDGLRATFANANRRYARRVNEREGWRGHFWQERYGSFPMDERHLLYAVRYVEQNPVRAKLVKAPGEWPWSSAAAHLARRDDDLVTVGPLLELVDDWPAFLAEGLDELVAGTLRQHESTGRPLGSEQFVGDLERRTGRRLARHAPGPKRQPE